MYTRTGRDDGWNARYPNDSRPWLINTGHKEEHPSSTMKESFPSFQNYPKQPVYGRRKALLKTFLMQEIAEEFNEEITKEPEIEKDVDSEYKNQFNANGFKPTHTEHTDEDNQNHLKFPLYTDTPRTVWMDRLTTLEGTTASPITKPYAVFHKNSSFTKPLTEVLDEPKPGSIGYV
ncbi:uncharacterized protein LOC142326103 [Lycorma delicatula]|uniref:uncharacterized protein LOC142326103 n=1 Tax=Lycorma delicatula TaxID=130591 RepID=UPI003F517B55